jgi:hypothetical protein
MKALQARVLGYVGQEGVGGEVVMRMMLEVGSSRMLLHVMLTPVLAQIVRVAAHVGCAALLVVDGGRLGVDVLVAAAVIVGQVMVGVDVLATTSTLHVHATIGVVVRAGLIAQAEHVLGRCRLLVTGRTLVVLGQA